MTTEEIKMCIVVLQDELAVRKLRADSGLSELPERPSFQIGERVSFDIKKFPFTISGIVERINQKTITVGQCQDINPVWRVSPGLLRKEQPATNN